MHARIYLIAGPVYSVMQLTHPITKNRKYILTCVLLIQTTANQFKRCHLCVTSQQGHSQCSIKKYSCIYINYITNIIMEVNSTLCCSDLCYKLCSWACFVSKQVCMALWDYCFVVFTSPSVQFSISDGPCTSQQAQFFYTHIKWLQVMRSTDWNTLYSLG